MECSLNSMVWLSVVVVVAVFLAGFGVGRMSAVKRKTKPAGKGKEKRATEDGVVELYIGNLSYDLTEQDLKKMFSSYGKVVSVRIIRNKYSEKSKGFGFVEMADQASANKAVAAMSGKDIMGRKMVVNEARSKSKD